MGRRQMFKNLILMIILLVLLKSVTSETTDSEAQSWTEAVKWGDGTSPSPYNAANTSTAEVDPGLQSVTYDTQTIDVTPDNRNKTLEKGRPNGRQGSSRQASAENSLKATVALNIDRYGGAFVLVLGVFGNLISVAVLCRARMRALPSSLYLLVLSASDLLFIIIARGLRGFLFFTIGTSDPLIWATWYCKFFFISTQTLSCFSNWVLAAITAERCIAVYVPLKAKQILRRKNGKIFLSICFVLILAYYSYGGNLYDIVLTRRGPSIVERCTIPKTINNYFVTEVRQWFQITISTLMPFAVIIPCNICIIVTFARSRSHLLGSKSEVDTRQVTALVSTLLSVTFAYVILTTPLRIAFIIQVAYDFRDQLLISTVTFLLHLNHSINFILYMVTGTAFRNELKTMMKSCLPKCESSEAAGDRDPATKWSDINSQTSACEDRKPVDASTGTNVSKPISTVEDEGAQI